MKRLWLLFSQAVTVLLAAWFVVLTLKPQWLDRWSSRPGLTLQEAVIGSTDFAPGSLSPAARKASPAVVSITTQKIANRNPQSQEPWFRFFFGEGDNEPQAGLGSGVIVSPQGYILTNNHVIEGADEIEVTLTDHRHAKAQLIGADPDSDLAVLRIDLDRLPVITWGPSEQLQVGDQVLAIGNPFGVGQTVTSGIVSALGRNQLGINTFENFIQTDAAINPGNSGGALVDVHGNLMGINTAIYSRSGGNLGIGFAIPAQTARQVLESLVKEGQVTRGWIGVEPQDLSAELARHFNLSPREAVVVAGVLQQGPAFKAGILPGDVLLSVGATPVSNVGELLAAVAALQPGQATPFKILRQDREITLSVTPANRPPSHAQRPR
jgi:serine protease DegQ